MEVTSVGLENTRHYKLRIFISWILFAIAAESGVLVPSLVSHYSETLPRATQETTGRVHAPNNHGTIVYLDDAETTGLSLILITGVAAILAFGIILPKNYVNGIGLTALKYNSGRPTVLLLTLIVYFFFVLFAGPHVVSTAVSHGLILPVMTT